MVTERIYYLDQYAKEMDAKVISCEKADNVYHVILDRTVFYPEGGGQPGDTGYLDGIKVLDTAEKDGEIVHITEMPLDEGKTVHGEIDWEKRFDLMQQHSGEHILSGFIHEKFGYNNVGFHMGADVLTIDFDGEISGEDLADIEKGVNDFIWQNGEIKAEFFKAEELQNVFFRSKKELTGLVRIISVPGGDVCACCGTHVRYTGEIGLVKILSHRKFRNGIRIEMLAGKRALEYINTAFDQNSIISNLLSAKMYETSKHVQRVLEENENYKQTLAAMEERNIAEKSAMYADKGDTILFETEMKPDSVRRLCDAVCKKCKGFCAVFSGNDSQGYKYTMAVQDGDLRQLTKNMNDTLGGRGGGKPNFVQGSVQAARAEIEKFFKENKI